MESDQTIDRARRTTGFASPAEDFWEKPLDINDLVLYHPSHTYLLTVGDTSLVGLGFRPGDHLLIDQMLDAVAGRTVWVTIEGESTIKRLQREHERLFLTAGSSAEPSVALPFPGTCTIDGIVTTVIRPLVAPHGAMQHAAERSAMPPGERTVEGVPDLNILLVGNPTATFFAYVSGTSMVLAGIHPGDVLIVDRSLEASHGAFVMAVLEGSLTLKRVLYSRGRRFVATADPTHPPVEVTPQMQLQIWGIATYAIHSLLGPFPHIRNRKPPP